MVQQRILGRSGLKVPVLGFGTATFGGSEEMFRIWGTSGVEDATKLVNMCLDAGVNFFDTADFYSGGMAEEILAQAIGSRRDDVLLATKVGTPLNPSPNDGGSSRWHILRAVENSLRRLQTDYVDVLYIHQFDATTPVEETVRVLDDLVTAGKVRYVGASNFPGWGLATSIATAERHGSSRYVAHQVSYSLTQRDYEWELEPAGAAHHVGAVAWSPLGGGALSGKVRRGQPVPADSRVGRLGVPADERTMRIVDELETIATKLEKSIAQVAINWVLQKPTVCSVVLGARSEAQLKDSLGAMGWALSAEDVQSLDKVSAVDAPYPYANQQNFPGLLRSSWHAGSGPDRPAYRSY
jgi:aryl-alcohol dehydrogenase-like predicted oxidoreductase